LSKKLQAGMKLSRNLIRSANQRGTPYGLELPTSITKVLIPQNGRLSGYTEGFGHGLAQGGGAVGYAYAGGLEVFDLEVFALTLRFLLMFSEVWGFGAACKSTMRFVQ